MKLIGYFKEYESPNYTIRSNKKKKIEFEFFNEILSDKSKIKSYLENGHKFASTMTVVSSLIEGDDTIIGGISHLTDGEWIWPSYLSYYFDKYNLKLNKYFINHIKKSNYQCDKVDKEKINKACTVYKLKQKNLM